MTRHIVVHHSNRQLAASLCFGSSAVPRLFRSVSCVVLLHEFLRYVHAALGDHNASSYIRDAMQN